MNNYRTHNCNELNLKNVGETVKLAGWVQTIRNLGGMKFIDLRDEKGITQIVVSAEVFFISRRLARPASSSLSPTTRA